MSVVALKIENLTTVIGKQKIHQDLNLEVSQGEILGLVGASGAGKTILLRTILGLMPFQKGTIKIFGKSLQDLKKTRSFQQKIGVLFQSGALFSSLTVGENIRIPMKEIAKIPDEIAQELILLKLAMVGLEPHVAQKYPSELSGGMIKRVALARALAIDAEFLFLDEPTSGLDPLSRREFDHLLKTLQHNLNLTVVMITHDVDTLTAICDRVAVLVDQKLFLGTVSEMKKHTHPWIRSYFQGSMPGKNR
ncbi:MAG: ABC transporter ATP-binding protein [Caedibacter sp. 38-128]|nr:ATP-binding cassette domain-containing protein [Holosporales bacterium]OJX04126.1 MAG: ABC transporter ATP-binding protein [Caedibacter sp. 38-128]